jgi:hypothetical protein
MNGGFQHHERKSVNLIKVIPVCPELVVGQTRGFFKFKDQLSKRLQLQGARRSTSGGVLTVVRWSESGKRNEADEPFSAACSNFKAVLSIPLLRAGMERDVARRRFRILA